MPSPKKAYRKAKSLPTRVWRWVVWDRRNATRVVLGVVGAVAAFTVWSMVAPYLTYDQDAAAAAAAASATPTTSATATSTARPSWMPTLPTATPSPSESAGALEGDLFPEGAEQYATAFVSTWLEAHTLPRGQWQTAAKAYTVGDATKLIELTDPLMVPKAAVVSTTMRESTPFDAIAAVGMTNGETVLVTLSRKAGEWKVTLYGPELVDE